MSGHACTGVSNLRMRLLEAAVPKSAVKNILRYVFNDPKGEVFSVSKNEKEHKAMVRDSTVATAKKSNYTSMRDIQPTLFVGCNHIPRGIRIVLIDIQRTPLKHHLLEQAAQAYIMSAALSCWKQSLTSNRQNFDAEKNSWSTRHRPNQNCSFNNTDWQPKVECKKLFSAANQLFKVIYSSVLRSMGRVGDSQ